MVTISNPTHNWMSNWIAAHTELFILLFILFVLIAVFLPAFVNIWYERPLTEKELKRISESRMNLARDYLEKHDDLVSRKTLDEMEYDQKLEYEKRQALSTQRSAVHTDQTRETTS